MLIADVYELAGQSRRTSESLARAPGQTAARWHVLSVLSDASPRRRGGWAWRQSVQRVVEDLVDDGQLELRANPDHARAPLVALTSAGRGTLASVVQSSDNNRAALLERAHVTADELHTARTVLPGS